MPTPDLRSVLNWCEFAKIPIHDRPVPLVYRERLRARPAVARAMTAEWPLRKKAA